MKTKLLFILLLANFSIYAQSSDIPDYIPSDGLLAYYPFNGNADDVSGNGSHGTVVDATITHDRFGLHRNAYYFNGESSYIEADVLN